MFSWHKIIRNGFKIKLENTKTNKNELILSKLKKYDLSKFF